MLGGVGRGCNPTNLKDQTQTSLVRGRRGEGRGEEMREGVERCAEMLRGVERCGEVF